jgi:hypothetical protein
MAIGGNWFKLISLGVLVGAGFSVGTYLAKTALGAIQNVTGFSPPLASYRADWDASLPPEEAYIPYQSYYGYGQLNELPYPTIPVANVNYTFDF